MGSYPAIPGVRVIGLGHRARHGKDTAGRLLARLSDGERYAFADAIRAVARAEHGMTRKDAPLLQRLGTEVYRARDPETWLRTLYWRIEEERPAVAIITDVRFPNEAQLVRQMGGTLVRVRRCGADGVPFVAPDRDPQHASEVALADDAWWQHTLTNVTGHEAAFAQAVTEFYRRWR